MTSRVCIILLLIAWGVTASPLAQAKGNQPAAVLPEAEYGFGTAIEGETVKHDFILYNKGQADLKIEKIETG
jgi:hypothetical protein